MLDPHLPPDCVHTYRASSEGDVSGHRGLVVLCDDAFRPCNQVWVAVGKHVLLGDGQLHANTSGRQVEVVGVSRWGVSL